MRAQPPPLQQFIDTLQKFKLAFNLLPKLRTMLKDPDAITLLHMLFSPLALVIGASRDGRGQPAVASNVESPLLTTDACLMFDGSLLPREMELWKSLGPAWTTPSNRWNGMVPFYYPTFNDGWRHPGFNMEDIGMALPSTGFGNSLPNPVSAYGTNGTGMNTFPNGPYVQQPVGSRPVSMNDAGPYLPPKQQPQPQSIPMQLQQMPSQQQQQQQQPVQNAVQPPPAMQQNQPPNQPPPAAAAAPPRGKLPVDPTQQRYLNELKARGTRIYQALIVRDGKNQKELSVKTGDIVEVLDSSKNWWKVKNYIDSVGFVPNTILTEYSDA